MPLPHWIEPGAVILGGGTCSRPSSAPELGKDVTAALSSLNERGEAGPVGIFADNSPAWIAADLAAHAADGTLVPLPGFFSMSQLDHVVRSTGMNAMWSADDRAAAALGFPREVATGFGLRLFERGARAGRTADAHARTSAQKVTFTSGSTGTPKGVCLTSAQQLRTARALAQVIAPLHLGRHLNVLPFSVLLENIAGVYVPLLNGAACICPSSSEVGVAGASEFDARRCLEAIARYSPDSMILLPQMLRALVAELSERTIPDPRIRSLRFVAIGGARTPPALIVRARDLGLPVYEGYGLSECASVVALNVPGADRVGSVGRPLPGTEARLTADGEVELSGRGFAGYLGLRDCGREPWLKTGDLGSIDADGYIYIAGRKDNVLITGYGRNVTAEWPESLLIEDPNVAQAAVFGEGRPYLVAVLAPSTPIIPDAALDAVVEKANRQMPAYARIGAWIRASAPFTSGNGLATANGRVRRRSVWERYGSALNKLYDTQPD